MANHFPKYANDPRVADFYAQLKPGLVLRGYATHGFSFGSASEYKSKCALIVQEANV